MSQTVYYTPADLNLQSDPEAVLDSVMDFTYDDEFQMMDFIMDSGDSDVPMAEQSGLDTNRVWDYRGGGYIDDDDDEEEDYTNRDYRGGGYIDDDNEEDHTNRVWDYRGGGYIDDDDDDDDDGEGEEEEVHTNRVHTNRVEELLRLSENRVWNYRNQVEGLLARLRENQELLAQLSARLSENENQHVSPSASRTFVDNLDSVVITQQDVENDNVTCAVCLDDMKVGEIGNQLPCLHRYHADCIVSWLVMKNTCPVCRHHLP